MQIKIIMLSGGYDSTGVLFWALGHPEWHVIAHHVELVNVERRWEMENAAVVAIMGYLIDRGINVEYSSSRIEIVDTQYCARDIVNVGFMAGIVAIGAYHKYRRHRPEIEVLTGGTLEDGVDGQIEARGGIYKKTEMYNLHFADWPAHLPRPRIAIPFRCAPKAEVAKHIPPELLPSIWTCRAPVRSNGKYRECGVCVSCLRKANLAITT